MLNINQEEEIVWLVQLFYYLEEMEKTIVGIKNWEEYLASKNKKKEENQKK